MTGTGEIIFQEFNLWVYNDVNQAGDQLQIILKIISKIVERLTIPTMESTNVVVFESPFLFNTEYLKPTGFHSIVRNVLHTHYNRH